MSTASIQYWSPYSVWGHKQELQAHGLRWTLRGHSVAMLHSCFYVDEWGVVLDAGLGATFSPLDIFVTHGHSDHTQALPALLTNIATTPVVHVPYRPELYRATIEGRHLLSSDGLRPHRDRGQYTFDLVEPFEGPRVFTDKLQLAFEAFRTDHGVVSVGYAIFQKRRKLKDEHRGKPPAELKAIAQGARKDALTCDTMVPLMVYTGDTQATVFDTASVFQRYSFPYIVTECTFVSELDPDPEAIEARAAETKHTLWRTLRPFVERHPETTFLLTHFSARYTLDQVVEFFARPGMPSNVQVWQN